MKYLISTLLHSRTQAHIFHLRTSGSNAYAIHNAMEDYYTEIVDLVDDLAETYQGKYGLMEHAEVTGMSGINNDASVNNIIGYFENLATIVEDRSSAPSIESDNVIQNYIDDILGLIYQTLYKLKHLG